MKTPKPLDEVLQAIEYYEQKLPSIESNESEATIARIQAIVSTLRWVAGETELIF